MPLSSPASGLAFTYAALAAGALPTLTVAQGGANPKNFSVSDVTLSGPCLAGVKLALINIQLSDPGNTAGAGTVNGVQLALTDVYTGASQVLAAESFTLTDSGGFTYHLFSGFNMALVPVTAGAIAMSMKDGAGGTHAGSATITVLGTFS